MNKKERFFKQLIQNFERKKVKYIFLRGHEFIKNNEDYGEVDILVKKFDLKKVRKVFKYVPACYQFKNNIDLTHPLLIRVVRNNFVVDLDFQIEGIGYCGSPLLKEDYLFRHTRKKSFYNILDNEAEFLMFFVHGFVFKRKLRYFKKYESSFFNLYNKLDKFIIKERLNSFFGAGLQEEIIRYLKKKDLESLFNLRTKMILKSLSKNPIEIYKVGISKMMRFRNYFKLNEFFYFINPLKLRPLISFIGVDGSGKTTLAHFTKEYLNKYNIKTIIMSGGVFSPLKKPFWKKDTPKINSFDMASYKKESIIKNLARLVLQIPKQIKIFYYRKKGFFVVTDRYIYDLVNFYSPPRFFRYLTKTLFQKPTKIFYIKSPKNRIIKRKKELTLNSIKKLQNNIESNREFFDLTVIENKDIKKTFNNLELYLNNLLKNV